MEKFDVVVVGAGTAGCLAAKTTAEAGLKVCLIERKRKEGIGEKICGDALGEHHLKNLGLEKPQGGELEKRIEGIKIYSPDLKTVFTVEHEDFVGYLLNRRLFGQWLLKEAVDEGAVVLDYMLCLEPVIENGFVVGVLVKDLKTGKKVELGCKMVMDASGFSAVVRRKLPEKMEIEDKVPNEDVEACYREIRQLKQETEDTKHCEIYLNQRITPGGYTWIFPKSGAKVNAGLGICMRGKFPNPKNQFYKYILTRPLFEGSLLLSGGSWYDPTRRPLNNMVGNGVAILGDAACLVNPIHGGGIGPSMLSGYLAGKTIIEALEKSDVSQKSLWSYNCKYMEMYGAKQAGLDVFRILLLTSRDEDLNYGMGYKLLTDEDVLKAGLGEEFHLNITETAKRVFRGLKRIRFLNKLRLTVNMMKQVKAHYGNYPDAPEEFRKWRMRTEALFEEAQSKLME
ncbi:MAG: NAD(P)/FAD-dependent oxidoreductase [Candidatus Bathyarchaeota archaeon]|nr:NAD(P)/FAD-dependent oxidoreductase [Candidatus Bathyarchaeota archaeon]MDH5786861.1 NAD(P)/FAD-dependent oxidoreductase [Candidatus Bathyarchaeota archaeon]